MADTQTSPIPGNQTPPIPTPGQPGLLGDFGNMGNAPASVGSATTSITQQMRQLPVADMIKSIAVGISTAQTELNKNAIAEFQQLAATNVTINGQSYNMLQLGFAPHFYFFQKVTIEVSFELKFHYEQTQTTALGLKANLTLGGEASRTTKTADDSDARKDKADAVARQTAARDAQKTAGDAATKAADDEAAATAEKNAATKKRTDAETALTNALKGKAYDTIVQDGTQAEKDLADDQKNQNKLKPEEIDAKKAAMDLRDKVKSLKTELEDAKEKETDATTKETAAKKEAARLKAAKDQADGDVKAADDQANRILAPAAKEEKKDDKKTG